jgi:ATP-dependent helicase/nuclease subunit A
LRTFVRRLRRSVFDEFEEEPSPSTEEGDDVVRVMTVHRAKGLEFPVVAMADLCGASQDAGASLLSDHATGQVELRFNKLTTAGFASANARQKLRDDAEEVRLLYVAATRAKEQLIVPWFVPASKPGRARHLQLGMAAVNAGQMTPLTADAFAAEPKPLPALRIEIEFDAKATGSKPIAQRRAWQKQRAELLARAAQPVMRVSPSKLAGEVEPEPREDEEAGFERERAMEFGSVVHAALEQMNTDLIAASKLSDADKQRATAMVQRALQSELFAQVGQAERVYRELPFTVATKDGLMEGKIDLLFCEKGKWTLVDYKTDACVEVERYAGQLRAYEGALKQIAGITLAQKLLFLVATGMVKQVDG